MLAFALAFLAGDLYLQHFTRLPSFVSCLIMAGCSLFFLLHLRKKNLYTTLWLGLLIGFLWSYLFAAYQLSWQLPKDLELTPLLISGTISSLPVIDDSSTHFIFALEAMPAYHGHTNLRLAWDNPPKRLKAGDKWQLLVRLKRIHSTQNPEAFDAEAFAIQQGLRAAGRVVKSQQNHLLAHHWYRYPLNHIRQKLFEHILPLLPQTATSIWLPALMVGERVGIPEEDWQVLRNTGTNHLMAIAGLHIGILAGMAHFIMQAIWRRIPCLIQRFPASLAGASASLMIAWFYSALAGFSIPTQRACIMITVFIVTTLLRRKIPAWHAWSLALLSVLLMNPLNVLSDSFWLSFGTLALIIYGMQGRLAPGGWWWKWGRVQFVIGVGLIPLSLFFYHQCSLVSFVANSLSIPWLGLLILPLCFFSTLFIFIYPTFSSYLLILADKNLSWLWYCLTVLASWQGATWNQVVPNYYYFAATAIGFILLLMPRGLPVRWMAIIFLLPICLYQPPTPQRGDYWLTLLDVGQGLSVVVQTASHILVFDAGPKFGSNFDMGESVVLPYVRVLGSNQIDMLVISHGDNDHIGGANALMRALNVRDIRSSVPSLLSPAATYCLAGQAWEWDQVQFEFLHPTQEEGDLGNDSSCVLSIHNRTTRTLLTGDIEKHAEKVLLTTSPLKLAADILVAPHHGSKTSGNKNFIRAIHPKYVLFATGYRNRYHFPNASVVNTYSDMGVFQFNTADSGAIMFKLEAEHETFKPALYRHKNQHYWFD